MVVADSNTTVNLRGRIRRLLAERQTPNGLKSQDLFHLRIASVAQFSHEACQAMSQRFSSAAEVIESSRKTQRSDASVDHTSAATPSPDDSVGCSEATSTFSNTPPS